MNLKCLIFTIAFFVFTHSNYSQQVAEVTLKLNNKEEIKGKMKFELISDQKEIELETTSGKKTIKSDDIETLIVKATNKVKYTFIHPLQYSATFNKLKLKKGRFWALEERATKKITRYLGANYYTLDDQNKISLVTKYRSNFPTTTKIYIRKNDDIGVIYIKDDYSHDIGIGVKALVNYQCKIYLKDCSSLYEKLNNKEFEAFELDKIIEYYNNNCGS